MKIALTVSTLMMMAAMAPSAVSAQLRGGGFASESTEAQDTKVKELAPPTPAEKDARRDLAVQRADRKQYFVEGGPGCAGTLVAPDVVLTSASCKDKFFGPNAPKSVVVGSTKLGELSEGSEILNIVTDSAVTHTDWNPQTRKANLMLFKVQPARMNAPIDLGGRDVMTYEDTITTFGFGKVTVTGGVASQDLLSVDLVSAPTMEELLGWPACTDWVLGANRSADGVSCGYAYDAPLSDACQASVGAPVVDPSGRLQGVTSYDDTCAVIVGAYSQMAYTKVVDTYRPWLEGMICTMSASGTYCPKPPATPPAPTGGGWWPDGTLCVLGKGCDRCCDRCVNSATYWYDKAFTACGNEPCWPRRTICGAGTTCNQCCNGYSWKLQDFFTSCN